MVTVPSLVDEIPLDQYTATASQTDFNFTYMIFATEDIKVYVNDVLKTETTDYVVKQSDGSAIVPANDLPMDGGKVVFNSGLTSGDKVSLSRDIAIERLTGYSVAGAFRADVVNAEFTKIFAVQQQLERDISRCLRLSASDAEGGSLALPTNRASKFLAFDANGDMIASAGTISTPAITVSSFMETVLDDTTAAAALTTLGISSYAQTLLDDTTAAAARTTLAAQQDVITTRGDIIHGSSSGVAERLAIGAANQILTSDGTDVAWSDNLTVNGKFNFGRASQTISSGSINYTQPIANLRGEGFVDDTLTTINGGTAGDTIVLSSSSEAITIASGTGNIVLRGGIDRVLSQAGDKITLVYDGVNWTPLALQSSRDFASSKAANGYQFLPSGSIIQWGYAGAGSANTTISFPITFPNQAFNLTFGSSVGSGVPRGSALTTSGFYYSPANYANTLSFWQAIGN